MLIISGSAQFNLDHGQYHKGDRHLLTLFSATECLEDNLANIEMYLNQRGWQYIMIEETQFSDGLAPIEHSLLKTGFEKAAREGLSLMVNTSALSTSALSTSYPLRTMTTANAA